VRPYRSAPSRDGEYFMTMTRNPLLKVSESEVGVSHVPAFEVFSEEIVAFAVRGGMYEEWIRFFRKVLDDDRGNTAVLDPLEIYRPTLRSSIRWRFTALRPTAGCLIRFP